MPISQPRRAVALAGLLAILVAFRVVGATSAGGAPVDQTQPTFSNPTRITNPLFPAHALGQAVQLGAVADATLRQEVTALDTTKVIRWNGQDITAVESQFLAYQDGEIAELATDYFAQADDGSVWYLGEDVTSYDNGRVENHDGAWRAGRDGPGGLIMLAHPHVGDTYRPENIPGLVYEEVVVMQTGLTVPGPTGPVHGAIKVQEHPMDGAVEDKVFAPGYGEFVASVPTEQELVTMAVGAPIGSAHRHAPEAINRLSDTARKLFDQGATDTWPQLSALARDAQRAWDAFPNHDVPKLVDTEVSDAINAVDEALRSRSRAEVRQAGIDLELATLDVEMRYDDRADIDRDRIEVWQLQQRLHQAAHDSAALASDRLIIAAIKHRLPT